MGILGVENESEEHPVVIAHDANEPVDSYSSLFRETRTISDRGLIAELSPLDGQNISAIPRAETHEEGLFNPTSSGGLGDRPVESIHHALYTWHAPPPATIGLHDMPQGVSIHNFPNDGHEIEQPGCVASESNPSQHIRQGMQVDRNFFVASNMTNVFPQNTDGSHMRFSSFSNTTEAPPLTMETQTMDGENWGAPVTLHQPITNQAMNSASYNDLQNYIAYDMSQLHIDPGAGPRETLANAAGLPDWVYKEPDQPSQDPFTEFPRADNLAGNVDMHSWNCA